MDAVHVDERGGGAAAETVRGPADAFFQHVGVPAAEAGFAAEDQHDAWVEQFERFGPLVGFLCVVFFRHLADLPWSPGFIAEGPVFDLKGVRKLHDLEEENQHCMASRDRSCGEGWRSTCSARSCSTQAIRELLGISRKAIIDKWSDIPSSSVPVPKFRARYGSVPTTSHHFMNSSVPN